MKKLTKYFFKGLAFLVPVVLTLYVIYAVFIKVDRLFKFHIPGMGVLVTLVVITVIGFIASVKDLIHAFVGEKKGFNRPVSVSLGGGIKAVGFITSDSLERLGMEGMVSVYLPQSYNFAGNLIMVPAEQVAPLQAESGDVMAFVVSGGITSK
jgi:uncharacterized membrane protein